MKSEVLTLAGFTKEIKEVSSGPHPRRFCFVLGAGASRASGIKSGQDLVNIWDKELAERNPAEYGRWKKELDITADNMYSFYSKYYEKRFKLPGDGYNYLEKLMGNAKPSPGYVMLSHILTKTNHNIVVTTNFDHLVENAVNYYAQTLPLVIGHETLASYALRGINRPTIIKIHRDLLFDPENRVDEVETLHENWQKTLDLVLAQYNPIFIGYAGNDNSLMNYLLKNSEKFLNKEWCFPYWMLYKDEQPGELVASFLAKSGGYSIRHNGFDEVLYLLGSALDYEMPSKEAFISDAEKRYQALANAIDEYTDKFTPQSDDAPPSADVPSAEIEQAMQKITDQTELQRMYREAVRLHNAGEYEKALPIKQELIQLDPQNAKYHNSLSNTLHELKRHGEALAESQQAIALENGNAKYHHSVGVTLHELKRYEESLDEKQKAIALEPENALYHNSIGVTLYELDRNEEALIEAQKAVTLVPVNAPYHHTFSLILYNLEHFDEAIAEIQKAIELDPENKKYYDALKRMQDSDKTE